MWCGQSRLQKMSVTLTKNLPEIPVNGPSKFRLQEEEEELEEVKGQLGGGHPVRGVQALLLDHVENPKDCGLNDGGGLEYILLLQVGICLEPVGGSGRAEWGCVPESRCA